MKFAVPTTVTIAILALGSAAFCAPFGSWEDACAPGKGLFITAREPSNVQQATIHLLASPDDEGSFYWAAQRFAKKNSYHVMVRMCRDELARHPRWAAPHYLLALSAKRRFEDNEASNEFAKAYRAKPCWDLLLIDYSQHLLDVQQYREAIDIASEGITLCQDKIKQPAVQGTAYFLHITRAKAQIRLERDKEAIPDLERARQLLPNANPGMISMHLAEAYVKTKQWDKAINEMTRCIRAREGNIAAYWFRAQAYAGRGDTNLALKDLSIYLGETPVGYPIKTNVVPKQVKDARLLRAQLYERIGKKDLAAKERKKVEDEMGFIYSQTPFRMDEGKKH